MLLARILLLFNGAAFALYGIGCIFSPLLVADYAGMELPGPDALTEVVAMYGGLQTGIGILFLYHGLQPARIQSGLVLVVVLLGSLALARTLGLLIHGITPYNLGAVLFESLSVLLALLAMRLLPEARPAN